MPALRVLGASAALLLAGCGFEPVETEIGHRGKARLDPFLAAGRFLTAIGHEVRVERSWPDPDDSLGMLLMPAATLDAEGYVAQVRNWVAAGGHLICLFDWSSAARGDWSAPEGIGETPSSALTDWLAQTGWEVTDDPAADHQEAGAQPGRWRFDGRRFEVTHPGRGRFAPVTGEGKARRFVSTRYGDGRLTLVADARPFRNRFIGEGEHAELLAALAEASADGAVVIVLGTNVSFWRLLWGATWPALAGLTVLTTLWLWRVWPRFGALEASSRVDDWRDYRRHLDAVGGFFWRIDRAASLLAPLRRQVGERLLQRRAAAGPEIDGIELAATIAGLPRERVARALGESPPADPATLTRVTGDLQQMLERL